MDPQRRVLLDCQTLVSSLMTSRSDALSHEPTSSISSRRSIAPEDVVPTVATEEQSMSLELHNTGPPKRTEHERMFPSMDVLSQRFEEGVSSQRVLIFSPYFQRAALKTKNQTSLDAKRVRLGSGIDD